MEYDKKKKKWAGYRSVPSSCVKTILCEYKAPLVIRIVRRVRNNVDILNSRYETFGLDSRTKRKNMRVWYSKKKQFCMNLLRQYIASLIHISIAVFGDQTNTWQTSIDVFQNRRTFKTFQDRCKGNNEFFWCFYSICKLYGRKGKKRQTFEISIETP